MTKRKNAKAPSAPPAFADTPTFTPLSKISGLSTGDVLEDENGQRYIYTADLRGSRWGRTLSSTYATGELQGLPDVPYRLVRSPGNERKEDRATVVDPMTETRRG